MSSLANTEITAPSDANGCAVDDRLVRLFAALRQADGEPPTAAAVTEILAAAGLRSDDARLRSTYERLARCPGPLDVRAFAAAVHGNVSLVERAITGELAIPDFDEFRSRIERIFEANRDQDGGEVANYIPQLARVRAESYALGVCTVDGQRLSLGDASSTFCVQSSCKPINYCLAVQDRGADFVHRHVGREPSGRSFNELSLNHDGKPHNPMINAGAIATCSLVGPGLAAADRFDHVTDLWARLAGGARPGFGNAVYLSERQTADRNFALGYLMREHGVFPAGTDLEETLEFYFQCCSLELDVERFAVVAAALANGGVSPITGERVLERDTVQKCLSLMLSCGLYDFSGEWAFVVGLPGKSSVSGVIFVVVPGKLGLCVWSPRLDRIGNSVRGVQFCRAFAQELATHPLDAANASATGGAHEAAGLAQLLWAASKDDVAGVRRMVVRGIDPGSADYDGRTALHVAASEGSTGVVRYLLEQGVAVAPVDRWGGTPLADAEREQRDAAAELLRAVGATPDEPKRKGTHPKRR